MNQNLNNRTLPKKKKCLELESPWTIICRIIDNSKNDTRCRHFEPWTMSIKSPNHVYINTYPVTLVQGVLNEKIHD